MITSKDKNIGLVYNCDMNTLSEYPPPPTYMQKHIFLVFDESVSKTSLEA